MGLFRSFRLRNLSLCHRIMFSYQKRCYSYDGEGKTTVTFLNREADDLLTIAAYSQLGFRLNSGIFVVGPVIVFPKTVLSWNVANDDDVNEDSLSLFCNLEPSVDVLVIGLGDNNSFKDRIKFMNKFKTLTQAKLNFELLPTEKAIATYNFLCIENRFVAAALIPPLKVDIKPVDSFVHNLENNMLGKDDYIFGDDSNELENLEKKDAKRFKAPPDRVKQQSLGEFFSSFGKRDKNKIKKD